MAANPILIVGGLALAGWALTQVAQQAEEEPKETPQERQARLRREQLEPDYDPDIELLPAIDTGEPDIYELLPAIDEGPGEMELLMAQQAADAEVLSRKTLASHMTQTVQSLDAAYGKSNYGSFIIPAWEVGWETNPEWLNLFDTRLDTAEQTGRDYQQGVANELAAQEQKAARKKELEEFNRLHNEAMAAEYKGFFSPMGFIEARDDNIDNLQAAIATAKQKHASAVTLREQEAALLEAQRQEDERRAEATRQREQAQREKEEEAQEEVRRQQAIFWQQEEAERKRLLAEDLRRIAEEKARIPVIVPYGTPRADPNIAIATGGAKDIMDVSWGYEYISGPPHLFITLKVIYKGGRTDQQPISSAAVPGQRRPHILHRFGAGIYQPGTHSVTLQIISTPTDRNEWTVHAEETLSFTIPAPPFHRRSFDSVANELGWGVYKQGKGYGYYRDGWYAYFSGNNQRVEDRWIREWYAGAQAGKRGKKMRPGQLGADRQPGLRAP